MSEHKNVLIIDDDMDICLLLKRFLSKNDFKVEVAHNGASGIEKVKAQKFDVVLCDFRLPDADGVELIKLIKKEHISTQVIIITGYSDVRMAVSVIKRGAFDYVTKPIHPEEILITINKALEQSPIINPSAKSSNEKKSKSSPKNQEKFVKGTSSHSKQLYNLMELVAPTNMTVVVLGESGTGKEVMACAIHENSKRKTKKFIAVDCGAIPAEIAGSELFGHKKGSFTGAINDKIGHFESADGGTLFLDEIGNLSYENQIKLLRVLQERKIKRIGENTEIEVDVRVIVATNEDLKKMVAKGTFREDLYYRLSEFMLELPPLRERKSEITQFANYLLKDACRQLEKGEIDFKKEVIDAFKNYYWPGNIREMKNVIKRATLLTSNDSIDLTNIPDEIIRPNYFEGQTENDHDEEVLELKQIVQNAEKKAILNVLTKTGYNKSKAAKILNVDRKTLYNKITEYNLDQ